MPRRCFTPDGDNLLFSSNVDGTIRVRYTLELAQYGPPLSENVEGTTGWYHFDDPGGTQQITDTAQDLLHDYMYAAFGEVRVGDKTIGTIFKYNGQRGYQQ